MIKWLLFAVMIVSTKGTPEIRIMTGNYYDYMVVETIDGNQWLIPEEKYEEVFQPGELLQVVFDTKGTEDVKDDVILKIRSIDKRY